MKGPGGVGKVSTQHHQVVAYTQSLPRRVAMMEKIKDVFGGRPVRRVAGKMPAHGHPDGLSIEIVTRTPREAAAVARLQQTASEWGLTVAPSADILVLVKSKYAVPDALADGILGIGETSTSARAPQRMTGPCTPCKRPRTPLRCRLVHKRHGCVCLSMS